MGNLKTSTATALRAAVKVGDRVIYSAGYRSAPLVTSVCKVTPKGWLRIIIDGADRGPFKPRADPGEYELVAAWNCHAYSYTDELFAKLDAEYAEWQFRSKEEAEDRKERQQAREDADRQRIAEVKLICGGKLPITSQRLLPDGSRLFLLDIPVAKQKTKRKSGKDADGKQLGEAFEILFCHTIASQKRNWETNELEPVVECALAYVHGGSNSFASCTGIEGKTDEDVLWEAVEHCYNAW